MLDTILNKILEYSSLIFKIEVYYDLQTYIVMIKLLDHKN
jgi:hypothetical protein